MNTDIEELNYNRYYRKSKKKELGFSVTKMETFCDMLSNFVEHCYKNIDELKKYEAEIFRLKYMLNR